MRYFGCFLLCGSGLHVELLVAEGLMRLPMAQTEHRGVLRILYCRSELIVLHPEHRRVETPICSTRGSRVTEQSLVGLE